MLQKYKNLDRFQKKFHICSHMKLFLLDGHAIVFRMYYALQGRPLINKKGIDTSILYNFTKYVMDILDREKPECFAVSFDPPGGTFRNDLYPAYKANRPPTPQLVIDALEPLCRILEAMGIKVVMKPGFEADDVIGSMAKKYASGNCQVYMVTPDKDYAQLVEDNIFQYKPLKGGENETLGTEQICKKWDIDSPAAMIDYLAICGDSSDNVPGVDGVGPKGACTLLHKYGSLDGIYAHIDELSASLKAKFEAARDHISLSRELVTIKTDIPVEFSLEDLRPAPGPEIVKVFDYYEFASLSRRLPAISGGAAPASAKPSSEALESLNGKVVAVSLENGILAVAGKDGASQGEVSGYRELLEDPQCVKCGYAMKSLYKSLAGLGIELKGRLLDVELMHYLLSPESNHSLRNICLDRLGEDIASGSKPAEETSLFDAASQEPGRDLAAEASIILRLSDILLGEVEKSGMLPLYNEIEEPLLGVLARMEMTGVRIDPVALEAYAGGLRSRMLEKEKQVRELAGEPGLNVSSPKQVGQVIFEKLKLDPAAKRPRSGNWPTDEQTLQALSDRSPIINAILDYRGLRKLLSTYIEPLPGYISPADGRVHTTFNQTLTSTGRLSSSNPNLQNIPVRTEEGREVRKAFVPAAPGYVIMSADYSQIELRLMAHFSADEHLVKAFRNGEDVHSATAAKIFGKDISQVSKDERRMAKTANFGIMYGISAFGLAQRLGCPRAEAKKIIDDYFASFPSMRSYIDDTLDLARRNGYVETLFGRRRYLPDILSPNAMIRSNAERNAINAPIQGTAADIIKMAMNAVDARLRREGLKSMMVLQIHDELLLEVPENEIERLQLLLKEEMENPVQLSVPLTIECSYGKNWLEAH